MNSIHTNLSSYGRYDVSLAVKLKNIAGGFSNADILDVSSLFSINHKKNAQFGAYCTGQGKVLQTSLVTYNQTLKGEKQ